MKYISFLIKPASSACDMRCSYCFYRDVADHRAHAVRELMSEETVRALVDRALGLGSDAQVTFAFQGGEPTLAGLDFFRSFTAYVDERRTGQTVSYALQTNGHSLTPEWAAFFREHGFLVGVSVDAYRELHDSLRGDIRLEPTHARAMESIRMLREAGVEFNVLTVLSAPTARSRGSATATASASTPRTMTRRIAATGSFSSTRTGLSLRWPARSCASELGSELGTVPNSHKTFLQIGDCPQFTPNSQTGRTDGRHF